MSLFPVSGLSQSKNDLVGTWKLVDQMMLARGFRTDFQGVAMHKPNEPGYNKPGIYLIDDWR
jgi:hypothetical protein